MPDIYRYAGATERYRYEDEADLLAWVVPPDSAPFAPLADADADAEADFDGLVSGFAEGLIECTGDLVGFAVAGGLDLAQGVPDGEDPGVGDALVPLALARAEPDALVEEPALGLTGGLDDALVLPAGLDVTARLDGAGLVAPAGPPLSTAETIGRQEGPAEGCLLTVVAA